MYMCWHYEKVNISISIFNSFYCCYILKYDPSMYCMPLEIGVNSELNLISYSFESQFSPAGGYGLGSGVRSGFRNMNVYP